jgi:hypothetical protein
MFIECTFVPQAWIRDNAVSVDPEGPTRWFIPMAEVTQLTGVTDMNKMDDDPFARDELRRSRHAPQWIKDWSGPFEIEWVIKNGFSLRETFRTDQDHKRYDNEPFKIIGMWVDPDVGGDHPEPRFVIQFADGAIHDQVNPECIFEGFDEPFDRWCETTSEPCIEKMKEDIVSDWFDTCMQDRDFLNGILQQYVETYSDEDIRRSHRDAFQ